MPQVDSTPLKDLLKPLHHLFHPISLHFNLFHLLHPLLVTCYTSYFGNAEGLLPAQVVQHEPPLLQLR